MRKFGVIATVEAAADGENPYEKLQQMLDEVRIGAQPIIVPDSDTETIAGLSADASVVLLPFRLKGNLIAGPSPGRVEELLLRLPTALLVMAAEDIDLDAEPEEGAAGEMAAAMDAVADADARARNAEKAAEKARQASETARQNRDVFKVDPAAADSQETLDALEAAAAEAQAAADKAVRRAAKARAKADGAVRQAEALGVDTAKETDGKKVED